MQHRTIYFLRKDEQRRSVAKQNSHQDKQKKFSTNLIYFWVNLWIEDSFLFFRGAIMILLSTL